MPEPSSSSGRKALEGALKHFDDPQSDLHRRVKRSLMALEASHKQLGLRFAARARKREHQEKKLRATQVAQEQAQLIMVQAHAAEMKKLNNEDVIRTAETLVKSAELQIDLGSKLAAQRASWIAQENGIDDGFRDLIDVLVATAVDALWTNTSINKLVGVLSGGLIVVGVATGPIGAALAAAASGVLLAGDLRRKLAKAKREANADKEAARLEQAVLLIDAMKDVTNRWLAIV